MLSSSQALGALVKLAALFSFGNEKPGAQFKSSVFKHADPSNLGRSLLEGSKDDLLNQAKPEFMRQDTSSWICAQRLELQDAQHGYIESRREQIRLQEESSLKERVLRDTQIQNIHELGEMKRAQEQRVDEFSVQK